MLNATELANTWKEIVKIYHNTRENGPKTTMEEIIRRFGIKTTKETFATVAIIKKHDGRIYGANREYINAVPVDTELTEWKTENPVIYAGLDDIHTSYINQLIGELRMSDK